MADELITPQNTTEGGFFASLAKWWRGAPSEQKQVIIHSKDTKTLLAEIGGIVLLGAISIWGMKYILDSANPVNQQRKEAREQAKKFAKKFGRPMKDLPKFDEYEMGLLHCVTFPEDITVTFNDVGGLADIKEEIYNTIILPLEQPELFASDDSGGRRKLLDPPRGVLFYGPPGTGKTLMAKAIAKDSGFSFINIQGSNIHDKWFGESNKLIFALFSLARKLSPCIVFIDEMDGFLRKRQGADNQHYVSLQTEFMSCWDGITTRDDCRVVVLGATNRPHDLDPAILRRLPRTFLFPMPNAEARESILRVIFANEPLDASVDIPKLASITEGYSGSDLNELCKVAAMVPIRELAEQERARVRAERAKAAEPVEQPSEEAAEAKSPVGDSPAQEEDEKKPTRRPRARPICWNDIAIALKKVKRTGQAAEEYAAADANARMDSFRRIVESSVGNFFSAPNSDAEDDENPPASASSSSSRSRAQKKKGSGKSRSNSRSRSKNVPNADGESGGGGGGGGSRKQGRADELD